MKINLNEEQVSILTNMDFDFDVTGDLSDDEILEIDDKVSDYFALKGIKENDEVNGIGLICESIIDTISEL